MNILTRFSLLFCMAVSPLYAVTEVTPTTEAAPSATTAAAIQAPAEPEASSVPPADLPEPVINCSYTLSPKSAVDPIILSTWAQKAILQSFQFSAEGLDAQMNALKPCYTEQGWTGFREALDKSGNLKAITTQSLTVASESKGSVSVTPVKDNQWKAIMPIQVVYQNDKAKLTQQLSVELLIGRKMTGELGILQIIASPVQK